MAAPVFGSASAETSVTVRRMHPESFCQFGFGSYALQPLPAPLHTVSLLRVLFAFSVRVVPPTAVTYCEAAGYSTPKPLSPDENVIGLLVTLKWPSEALVVWVGKPAPAHEIENSTSG